MEVEPLRTAPLFEERVAELLPLRTALLELREALLPLRTADELRPVLLPLRTAADDAPPVVRLRTADEDIAEEEPPEVRRPSMRPVAAREVLAEAIALPLRRVDEIMLLPAARRPVLLAMAEA